MVGAIGGVGQTAGTGSAGVVAPVHNEASEFEHQVKTATSGGASKSGHAEKAGTQQAGGADGGDQEELREQRLHQVLQQRAAEIASQMTGRLALHV